MKYQDIHTGKVFEIKSNKVIDQFGNVATISTKEWLEMQSGDVIKLEMKKTCATAGRDLFGYQVNRGKVMMNIDATTSELANNITVKMMEQGFDAIVEEESDQYCEGVCVVYYVDSSDVSDFNVAYNLVKAELV